MTSVIVTTGFILLFVLFIGIWLIAGLISYLLYGLGLYDLAIEKELKNPWFAFIPVIRKYLHGQIAGEIELGDKKLKNPGIWMAVIPILAKGILGIFVLLIWFGYLLRTVFHFVGGNHYAGGEIGTWFLLLILISLFSTVIQFVVVSLTGLVNYQIFEDRARGNMRILHVLLCAFIPYYQSGYYFYLRHKRIKETQEEEQAEEPEEAQTQEEEQTEEPGEAQTQEEEQRTEEPEK